MTPSLPVFGLSRSGSKTRSRTQSIIYQTSPAMEVNGRLGSPLLGSLNAPLHDDVYAQSSYPSTEGLQASRRSGADMELVSIRVNGREEQRQTGRPEICSTVQCLAAPWTSIIQHRLC